MVESNTGNAAANDAQANPKSGNNNIGSDTSHSHFSPESLVDALLEMLHRFYLQVRRVADFVMSELGGYEAFDMVVEWCVRNPHLAICLLAAGLVFLLPFLIIFGFGIATMVMTFTGILVLEGTLLTVVSMMFFACLGGFAIVVVMFAVVAAATYFGFSQIYGFYGGIDGHKETLLSFMQKQRRTEEPQTVGHSTDA